MAVRLTSSLKCYTLTNLISDWHYQFCRRYLFSCFKCAFRYLHHLPFRMASKCGMYDISHINLLPTIWHLVGYHPCALGPRPIEEGVHQTKWYVVHCLEIPSICSEIGMAEKERKLEKLKQQRDRKAAELESLDALDACLSQSGEKFETITSRLGKFAAVWGAVCSRDRIVSARSWYLMRLQIQADLKATEEYLDKAEKTDTNKHVSWVCRRESNHCNLMPFTQFLKTMFDTRLDSACELYIVLADILREYQRAVDAECQLLG